MIDYAAIDRELPKVRGKYRLNYNLAHLAWFKVGGPADVYFKPEDEQDLSDFLKQNKEKLPIFCLGAGSNILIRDGGIEGVVIKLGRSFTDIVITEESTLTVGAACLNYNCAKFAASGSIKGFEFLVGIPGTIGGGIAMNAGAYGAEFKDVVKYVHALDLQGNKHILPRDELGFGYRTNNLSKEFIFTKVEFILQKGDKALIDLKMREINYNRSITQPITDKTGGSTFANPLRNKKAWELIDAAGLRGREIGGARFSEKHCNFMVNYDNASADDLEMLGELAGKEVKNKFGIELEWEIKRVGRHEKT